MRKELEKKFDKEFGIKVTPDDLAKKHLAKLVEELWLASIKDFIDEHFVERGELNTWNKDKKEFDTEIREVYTKEQVDVQLKSVLDVNAGLLDNISKRYTKEAVLELIGEDSKIQGLESDRGISLQEGYNRAKKEIRDRL